MGSKPARHKVSISALPRTIDSISGGKRLRLNWDRKLMSKRMAFVLELMCESPTQVHIEFVDALQMGALNWQFRGKDKPTDVLSFPPHPGHDAENAEAEVRGPRVTNLGELAVCIPVCVAQAKTHRCSLSQEIERMMIHGLVHLKGFDHERSEAAYAVMTLLERGIRTQMASALGEPLFCSEETPRIAANLKGRKRK